MPPSEKNLTKEKMVDIISKHFTSKKHKGSLKLINSIHNFIHSQIFEKYNHLYEDDEGYEDYLEEIRIKAKNKADLFSTSAEDLIHNIINNQENVDEAFKEFEMAEKNYLKAKKKLYNEVEKTYPLFGDNLDKIISDSLLLLDLEDIEFLYNTIQEKSINLDEYDDEDDDGNETEFGSRRKKKNTRSKKKKKTRSIKLKKK